MTAVKTIAHYRIIGKLGEGGMGAVYRATDTKLDREVAIKVLPDSFASDPDRMARFTREAQVLASLNHPNIATIHGIEERAIIMELVEGNELKGPLPLETALDYASQIASALEAAHEKGITHRDLKPANIKVTPQGVIKVLDFGLAKIAEPATAPSTANSPTLTIHSSEAGMIMGTAAYMSPEQARGQAVDKRADIWAFGVVLWEMLTGRQMFEGDTVSDVLAGILKSEPNLTGIPDQVKPLLSACLQKDPRKRLRDIGDWRRTLAPSAEPTPAQPTRFAILPWIVAACFAAVAVIALWSAWRMPSGSGPTPMLRLAAMIGDAETVLGPLFPGHLFAISPDGTRLAMTVNDPNSPEGMSLAVRKLQETSFIRLPGTDGAHTPFFSPDNRWVAFWSDGKIRKAPVDGGASVPICDLPNLRGGVWLDDGHMIVAGLTGPLLRVPADGGSPAPFTQLAPGEVSHRHPQWTAGSELLIFTSTTFSAYHLNLALHAVSLKTGRRTKLLDDAIYGRQLANGYLVYQTGTVLFGSRFDPRSAALRGARVPLLEQVNLNPPGGANVSISDAGTLVYYRAGSIEHNQFARIPRGGEPKLYGFPNGNYSKPELSPDGKRLATLRFSQKTADVWIGDLARGVASRATSTGNVSWFVWSSDGKHLLIRTRGGGDGLWWISSDGSGAAQRLAPEKEDISPIAFSPDGKRLIVQVQSSGPNPSSDLFIADFIAGSPPALGERRPFITGPFRAGVAAFSPDGHWIAYDSEEDGSSKVFVRPFPGPGPRVQVSRGWGQQPRWSATRQEILYQSADRTIAAVPFTIRAGALTPGEPARWAAHRAFDYGGMPTFDVLRDGENIVLMTFETSSSSHSHLTFVLNFFDEVKRRLP